MLLGCYFADKEAHALAVKLHPMFRGKVLCVSSLRRHPGPDMRFFLVADTLSLHFLINPSPQISVPAQSFGFIKLCF